MRAVFGVASVSDWEIGDESKGALYTDKRGAADAASFLRHFRVQQLVEVEMYEKITQ